MLQLVVLLPDMLLKLEHIKADIVLQLVRDPEARCRGFEQIRLSLYINLRHTGAACRPCIVHTLQTQACSLDALQSTARTSLAAECGSFSQCSGLVGCAGCRQQAHPVAGRAA